MIYRKSLKERKLEAICRTEEKKKQNKMQCKIKTDPTTPKRCKMSKKRPQKNHKERSRGDKLNTKNVEKGKWQQKRSKKKPSSKIG